MSPSVRPVFDFAGGTVVHITSSFSALVTAAKPAHWVPFSGAVAGLATVTQGAGFVEPFSAILIGLIAGAVCFLIVAVLKTRLKYDDSLDAFGVHSVGGFVGS